jgi:hypothetical protein
MSVVSGPLSVVFALAVPSQLTTDHGRDNMKRILTALLCVLCVDVIARAGDLFQVTAAGGNTSISSGSSSLLGLVENLSNNTNQFEPLANKSFNATLTYAGIKNAFTFQQSFTNSGSRVINFQVPSVGVNQTFTSANGSLDSQLRDYLKKDGLAALTEFQANVGQNSFAGIIDGNPMATTALLADAGYQEFALHEAPVDLNGFRSTEDGGGHFLTRFWISSGAISTAGVSGAYVDFTFASELHFNDVFALSFTTPLRYEALHSADIFMGGEIVGLPINLIPARGGWLTWTLTPAVQGGLGGSQDFVSGGLMYGGQIDSSLSANFAGFTFTLADGISYDHGADIGIAGYDFNTHVNQWIFKNGLQASKSFGNFFVDASGTWTDFLHQAYVPGYFTPEVGCGFAFGPNHNCGIRIGFQGNYGEHFNSTGGNILLYLSN